MIKMFCRAEILTSVVNVARADLNNAAALAASLREICEDQQPAACSLTGCVEGLL